MKKSIMFCIVCVAVVVSPSCAAAQDCEFSREIEQTLDADRVSLLSVVAGAGTLVVTGEPGVDEIRIRGTVCASSEEWAEESGLDVRSGETARIEVELPDTDGRWFSWGDRYAYLNLELSVPGELELDIDDTSGSIKMNGTGAASIRDSSGSMTIENTRGSITIRDTSGSIRLSGIGGDVMIVSDSSGGISGDQISGSVTVGKDSSGSIHFANVAGDFLVERDSSGSITADGVGGNFSVLEDGSGSITALNVEGEVTVPSG